MSEDKEYIHSTAVRAGKRTYFFDVRATRGRDLYLTITESKKRTNSDGSFRFEKHKIFLYKEDFDKFMEGFRETLEEIDRLRATGDYKADDPVEYPRAEEGLKQTSLNEEVEQGNEGHIEPDPIKKFTDVDFDDLKG